MRYSKSGRTRRSSQANFGVIQAIFEVWNKAWRHMRLRVVAPIFVAIIFAEQPRWLFRRRREVSLSRRSVESLYLVITNYLDDSLGFDAGLEDSVASRLETGTRLEDGAGGVHKVEQVLEVILTCRE